MSVTLATASWQALGTTALVRVADARRLARARMLLSMELDAIDRAASRFREDSELSAVNRAAGRPTRISPLLHEAIKIALDAAAMSDGAVDPTLGEQLIAAGYARDFAELEPAPEATPAAAEEDRPHHLPATRSRQRWREIGLTPAPHAVTVPAGVSIDLGATAKALAADRAAARISAQIGVGVLVSLGGDIAVSGPAPAGGWAIHVTDDHRETPAAGSGQTVTIDAGGLATSSTTTRRWRHHDMTAHHIIDPRTGAPAVSPWRTASVAAATCVGANVASTAAIVLGERAPAWLATHRLAARLVSQSGSVTVLGGWPAQDPVDRRPRDGSSTR